MPVYVKKTKNGRYQLRVRHPLLPGNHEFYATFDHEQDAQKYGDNLHACLERNIVPKELLDKPKQKKEGWSIARCISEYMRTSSDVKHSDEKLLDTIRRDVGHVMTWSLTYGWAEAWIQDMKHKKNLAPGTIRHRHGALARCLDRIVVKHPELLAVNPLRQLKKGFSTYNRHDARIAVANGGTIKQDEERNRRLSEEEEVKLRAEMRDHAELALLFDLALETAMRMRECYTLSIDQIDLDKRTIFLDKTKNGDTREVPMSRPIHTILANHLAAHRDAINARDGRLFSWWKGQTGEDELNSISSQVSRLFSETVKAAGLKNFHFHDLRHEATCRMYQRTSYTDVLIARITGHHDLRMLKRYASLRGSELADGMWGWHTLH